MIDQFMSALSAAAPHAEATARPASIPGFLRRCVKAAGSALTMLPRPRRNTLRLTAQDQAAANIVNLLRHRNLLLSEKEILIAERGKAKEAHKAVSRFDARLRAINKEILSIG